MNWFLIALINPLAHSIANHFDKYLLSKHIKGGTVGALIVFSSLFTFVALPIMLIIRPEILTSVSVLQAVLLIINGALVSIAIAFYLYALNLDEASYVAPFFQFIPLFGFALGYIFLGEVLTRDQFLAALLIVLGSLLLSIEFTKARGRFKSKVITLMIASSFFYALNAVIFKLIAVDQGFLESLFWDMLGKFLFGFLIFLSVRKYRQQFFNLIEKSGFKIMVLNIASEIIGLIGELAIVLAVLLAPIALVQSVGVVQPLFVLLIGVLLTIHFPKYVKEEMSHRHLAQKFVGIGIVTVGVLILTIME
jgi:drug/metabolite transporter (DMT)-like permease